VVSIATTTGAKGGAAARQIVLATRSAGKLRELGPLLATHGWDAITLDALGVVESADEEGLEQYDRFEENALAKARYFATLTGRLVLADDSGLAVEALGGRPGVHSKRWSGSALQGAALDAFNNAYLQERLREAEAAGRSSRAAAYECAAACAWPEGAVVAHGCTTGQVLSAPRGTGGFGYDPYFWSEELQATFAEVTRDAKAAVSHRGRAVRAVLAELSSFFPLPVDPTPRRG
jgi:XTP/dITP diphosphohydrolase